MNDESQKQSSKALRDVERPINAGQFEMGWGSDLAAQMLRTFDIPYIALNPGASYRGLHDSLVNYLGNRDPQMLIALHEEHAVAMAHGYAKVTGKPMAVALHSNVGLMHGTMAIFNAWCDRVPMLILGATGPMDASRRRPWIEWIHTAKDQGALIRDYVKWDDQPATADAVVESMLRAWQITRTAPNGPVYVCLDLGMQEDPIETPPVIPNIERFSPGEPPAPSAAAVDQAADLLAKAERPLILAGRVSREREAWDNRIRLAEMLKARVMTDLKAGSSFPTSHSLHPLPPIKRPAQDAKRLLVETDVILALDWIDLAGTYQLAAGDADIAAKVINCTVDPYIHNGWSMDHHVLPPADVRILAEPDVAVASLIPALEDRLGGESGAAAWDAVPVTYSKPPRSGPGETLNYFDMAAVLDDVLGNRPATLIRVPLGWPGGARDFDDPLAMLGGDGGAGIGSGPGMAVGAALALQGTGRLPIAILGDGDCLMGLTAFWTAAKYRIPLLVIVGNNHSYFNDVLHQERVAVDRNRPPENRWVGQEINDPTPDIVRLVEGLGWQGRGTIADADALHDALQWGVEGVLAGGCRLIDVEVVRAYNE